VLEQDIKEYELEITADCNAECPLCARTEAMMPLRGNPSISLDNIRHIFATRESCEGKSFKLCGVLGDPIVHPECFEICEYLTSNGGYVSISTNGGMNDEEWWTRLGGMKGVSVFFAVDGFENTNHIYRVNVNWKTLERNIRAFMSAGGKGTWVFIPFAHNEDDYEKALSFSKELGMKFIKRTSGRNDLAKGKRHKPRKAEAVILDNSQKLPHNDLTELKKLITSKDVDKLEEAVPTIKCKHYDEPHAFIGADMTLWPCCFLYDESHRRYYDVVNNKEFNDLTKFSIDEILQTDFYKTLKSRWYASHPEHLKRCIRTCALNGAYQNKLEKVVQS
jgi:MoaA/NifB/PqqE/SkfB family radical SAM enzyme